MKAIRIATRASDLALAQARTVAELIEERLGATTVLVPMKTSGDRLPGIALARWGGKGLFVKELEEALLSRRADVAVHSAKDLPGSRPAELELAAVPERADPRDALVSRAGAGSLEALERGARVGTGSARRAAQLRRARPDLQIVPLRGNVPTRLARLDAGGLDALVLACAGLDRLGLAGRIAARIPPETLLPAVAQGALALEARRGEPLARELAAALDDPGAATAVAAERAFLAGLGGDCTTPLAAFAEFKPGGQLRLRGLVIAPDGGRAAEAELESAPERAAAAGAELAARVLAAGGRAILDSLRAEPTP